MLYTSEQIAQINNAISIVDYAKQHLFLEYRNGEYWSICPFHDDVNASLSFNAEKNVYKCFGCNSKGALINFIMQYHKKKFPEAIAYIVQTAHINIEPKEPSEIYEYLNKVSRKKSSRQNIKHTYLPEDIMDQYSKEPIKEWLEAGISQDVLDKYDVRYNKQGNAIVYPIRDIQGRILAIKARTLFNNHNDLGIPKYIYYQPIGTNDFLGCLYNNISNIKFKNECIVVEGFKGVLLAESQGYNNVVSLETNHINDCQIQLLLSLKCNITFALDKGVNIDRKTLGLLPKFTNVYVIKDKEGLINEKDCPFDYGKYISDQLYEGRYLFK